MIDSEVFRAWLAEAGASAPHAGDIPLLGYDQLDLQDAQAAALLTVLAEIIEATCVVPCGVPLTHVTAA
jgi:hypothetical protein